MDHWHPSEEADALTFGTAWHSVLQAHYETLRELQQGPEGPGTESHTPARNSREWDVWADQCAGAVKKWMTDNIDWDSDTWQRLTWMYQGYINMYGLDESWIIREVEVQGTVELAPGVDFVYIVDLIVDDLEYGGRWGVDHKSASKLPTTFAMELDDQGGLYWWAYENDPTWADEPKFNGFLRRASIKKMNVGDLPDDQRGTFKNGKLKGTPSKLENRFTQHRKADAAGELEEIRADAFRAAQAMKLVRDGKLEAWSSPDPENRCPWRCQFREVHIQMRKNGGDVREAMEDFDMLNWNDDA